MNIRIIGGIALSAATAFGFLCNTGMRVAWTAPAPPTEACTRAMSNAAVDEASKVGAQKPAEPDQKPPTVSLGDMIAVRISGLAELQSACAASPIVLYLNNYPIKSLKPFPPTPPPTPAAGGGAAPNPPLPPNSGEQCTLIRFADDAVLAFEDFLDAKRVMTRAPRGYRF